MATPSQITDGNYKPVPGVYVPASTQFAATQGGNLQTSSDGTPYAPGVVTQVDGYKTTYSAAINGLVPVASATDVFTITGGAGKTVRVTRVEVSGIATTILDTTVRLAIRSSADLTGTSASVAAVPHDSNSPAAVATVLSYTANPGTLGTLVGYIRSSKVLFNLSAPAAGSESGRLIEDFGDRPAQAVVLRGTSQVLAVNLAGVSVAGGSLDISIEWSEE